jgi:hypothetical protein
MDKNSGSTDTGAVAFKPGPPPRVPKEVLRLIVHPLGLRNGKRLFENKDDRRVLEFVDTRTLGTGVI